MLLNDGSSIGKNAQIEYKNMTGFAFSMNQFGQNFHFFIFHFFLDFLDSFEEKVPRHQKM